MVKAALESFEPCINDRGERRKSLNPLNVEKDLDVRGFGGQNPLTGIVTSIPCNCPMAAGPTGPTPVKNWRVTGESRTL